MPAQSRAAEELRPLHAPAPSPTSCQAAVVPGRGLLLPRPTPAAHTLTARPSAANWQNQGTLGVFSAKVFRKCSFDSLLLTGWTIINHPKFALSSERRRLFIHTWGQEGQTPQFSSPGYLGNKPPCTTYRRSQSGGLRGAMEMTDGQANLVSGAR